MDDYFTALAQAADGVFSRVEALRWGMTDNDLSRLVRSGALVRPRRGVYALPRPRETPERDHGRRVRAILRGREAHAAARSTPALVELPLVNADLATVVLCGPGAERYRRGDVITYPMPRGESGLVVEGVRTVAVETAIFQTVARDSLMTAIVAADAALHRGLVSWDSLQRRRASLGRLAPRGRQLLAAVDESSESPGESVMRLILIGLGHQVQTQVQIFTPDGEFVARVDGLVDGFIVTEFDGAMKYEGAEGRAALFREKQREDALRALGYVVIRVTWADLFTPGRLAAMIRAAHARVQGPIRGRSVAP